MCPLTWPQAGRRRCRKLGFYPSRVTAWAAEGPVFIGALFGDSQVSFTPDGEPYFHSGRNGRLHVKEPDGSVRGNHPYLSAVAVLRLVHPLAAWAVAMLLWVPANDFGLRTIYLAIGL
jgi:hypothetical protein